MKFFSKVVFICNGCFILAVLLRWIENAHKKNGNFNGSIQIQPLESSIVVLGYSAIVINALLNIILLTLLFTRYNHSVAKWLIWVNSVLLFVQIYYFFLSNF